MKSSETAQKLLWYLILIVLGVLIGSNITCNPDNPIGPTEDGKPDTTFVGVPYPVPGPPGKDHWYPRKVIVYEPDTPNMGKITLDSAKHLLRIIDSLGDQIVEISNQYLLQFPNNPKVIRARLTNDSLVFDLLKPDGRIYSNVYLPDYYNNKYTFNGFELTSDPVKHGLGINSESWAYAGYDLLFKCPTAEVEYVLSRKRIKLGASAIGYIQKNPELGISVKAGFRLNGDKGKNK